MSASIAGGDATGAPSMPDLPGSKDWFRTTEQVLHQELDHLSRPRPDGDTTPWQARADEARLAALCLSGGGIRSATFCLGALQALAARRMLGEFHYLSTVSGGGFAGGWLQMFIRQCGGIAKAEERLKEAGNEAFAKLREYTNYLTPDVGLLSKDTWAGIVLYVRNTLLNWLVILPLLLFVPLGLLAYRTALEAGRALTPWLGLGVGSAALLAATFCACVMLPSHRPPKTREQANARQAAAPQDGGKPPAPSTDYASVKQITICIIGGISIWALAVPFALRAFFEAGAAGRLLLPAFGVAYFVVQFLAYFGALMWQQQRGHPGTRLYRRNLGAWLLASVAAATLIWWAAELGVAYLENDRGAATDPATAQVSHFLTVVAPLGLILAHLVQSVLFIGLRQGAERADLDREWVARVDGQLLLAAVGWTGLCVCCLVLPALALEASGGGGSVLLGALSALVPGPVAALLGKQVFARAQTLSAKGRMNDLLMIGLSVMAAIFGVSLFALMGWSLGWLLGQMQLLWGDCLITQDWADFVGTAGYCFDDGYGMAVVIDVVVAFILAGAIWFFGRVNVNRFSMHGVYRNRLTRGFLGSGRKRRDADPFTDFDEGDSPRIAELGVETRLFPVVNMTLNLTDILRTQWAERKAASFTATPFACGSAILDRADIPRKPPAGKEPRVADEGPRGAFIRSTEYAGMETSGDKEDAGKGPLLGGLLTISGAAVSPNWGYHSSRLIAFLMTMFNVRLGAWLPNPAVAKRNDLKLAKPRNSVFALVSELRGRSTDVRQAVYLSDGGHFDNLGLYEMLRRRCARIVVIDAGQDEKCTFFDLGNAIRKAEVDGLARVQMGEMRILARATIERDGKRAGALGFARGTITYPGARDAATLIYIKPTFLDDIPAEVRAYGADSASFPHESTANQWFSESQFESYRALGFHQVSRMFGSRLTTLSEWSTYLDNELNRRATG